MPLPRGTKKPDNVRKYQNEYNAKYYKTAACKISVSNYEQFQAYAKSQGKTVSGLLTEYINSCIAGTDPGNG